MQPSILTLAMRHTRARTEYEAIEVRAREIRAILADLQLQARAAKAELARALAELNHAREVRHG